MNRMVRRVNSYKKRVNRLIERKNTTRRWLEEEEKLHQRRGLHPAEMQRSEEHGSLLKLHLMPPIELALFHTPLARPKAKQRKSSSCTPLTL